MDRNPTFATIPPLKGFYLVRGDNNCTSQQCGGNREVFRPTDESIQYATHQDFYNLRERKMYGSLYRKLTEIFIEKRVDVYLTIEEINSPSVIFKRKVR
jgi:hypothetical protein